MLVGRALVAIDRDALIDGVAVEVEFFAQRLHDELLEIFGEEHQAVLVGEHHHVLAALGVACEIPHQCE